MLVERRFLSKLQRLISTHSFRARESATAWILLRQGYGGQALLRCGYGG
jgi:hypothetical protein